MTAKLYNSLNIYTGLIVLTVYFLIQAGWINFTFAADDYYYLAKSTEITGLRLQDNFVVEIFARAPLHALAIWLLFQLPIDEDSLKFIFYVLFILNAVILRHLLKYLFIQLGETDFETTPEFNLSWLIVSCYPCTYEILYWATASCYIYGAIFLVMGLNSKGAYSALFYYSALLFSEMYYLPIIAFIIVVDLRKINNAIFMNLKTKYTSFIVAIILTLVTKSILGYFIPSGEKIKLNTDIIDILSNISDWLSNTYSIHFYKIYPITLIWIATYIYIQYKLTKNKELKLMEVVKINLLILFPFSISLIMMGPSIRAMYGAVLFMMSMLGWLLYIWQKTHKSKIPLIIIALIFVTHQAYIFNIKTNNYEILTTKKSELIDYLESCEEPCTVNLYKIAKGFKRDYIMPIYYTREFVEWMINKNNIAKEILFIQ